MKYLLFILLLTFSTTLFAYPNCLPLTGDDYSLDYLDLFKNMNENQIKKKIKPLLKNKKVLIIPGIGFDLKDGFYNELDLKIIKLFIEKFYRGKEKFLDLRNVLTSLEVPHYQLSNKDFRKKDEASKIKKIAELIKSSKKDLIIFAYSKGGTDLLDALIELNKNIFTKKHINKIKGIILLQVPIQGSPLASYMYELSTNPRTRWPERVLNYLSGINRKTAKKLSIDFRENFNQKHINFYRELNQKIRFLSFSSYIHPDSKRYQMRIFKKFRNITYENSGLDNDGVITCNSGMPGSKFVTISEFDHLTALSGSKRLQRRGLDYNRTKMTLSLLSLLFE